MAKKKKNPPDDFVLEDCSMEEKMKYEIAKELDLYEKVRELGWSSLTARETGKIGGLVAQKRKTIKADLKSDKLYDKCDDLK